MLDVINLFYSSTKYNII